LAEKGPKYGYFPKASKSWLIVKESLLEEAKVLFADTEVQITSDGKRHLGAAVGSAVFKNDYISEKVEGWVASIERLAKFAVTQPHAAFSAFTHRLQSRWTFVSRTVPGLVEAFQPIEDAIRTVFIPSLLGREVNDLERDLFALPARHSGLGIFNPCVNSSFAFDNSVELTAPLVALFSDHESAFVPADLKKTQNETRRAQKKLADIRFKAELESITRRGSSDLKKSIKKSSVKGASNWVTARPPCTQNSFA
jgi:hypothetical protein